MFEANIFLLGEFVILLFAIALAGYFHHSQGGGQSSEMLIVFGFVFSILTAVWALICFVW